MQGSGKDGGGFDLDTAHNNKTLLLLCAGLLLLIFMDLQARRHSRHLAESTGRTALERGQDLESKIEPILRPVRKSAREAFGSVPEVNPPSGAQAERALGKLRSALGSAGHNKEPRPGGQVTSVRLYFLRFQGGRPRAVEVERRFVGQAAPEDLLRLLREGPLPRERGLLSAVESVPFGAVQVEDGTAIVEAGSNLARNGPRLVRARIEQVVLTLTRLPQIRRVRFSINGEVVDTVAGVPVEARLPKARHAAHR